MSKKIRLRVASLLALFMLGAMLSGGSPVAIKTRAQSAGVAPTNTRNASIVATSAAVLQETSEIRQLSILRPVKSGAQSRAEIERMIMKNMDEESTPEDLRASELALKKLGLVSSDFHLRPFLIKLLTEQVAGYYDPKAQEFFLADWINLDGQKPVMAHELTHALQDQHFNLRRFEKWPKGDSDAELAAHGLIEGDATLAMELYMARNPLRALAFVKSLEGSGSSSEQIDHAPRVLRETLLFPYDQGLTWVTQLYKRGGWPAVSQAYKELPQSSEQILHPDKYLAREAPVKINLPNISSDLGANWKRIDYDVNGEWSYFLMLDEYLKSDAESKRAAAGWGGDRYALFEGPNAGELVLAQLSDWDSEKDAREFFDAYSKRTWRRYKDAKATEIASNEGGGERHAWNTSEGNVVIVLRGTRVLILEGLPDKADANALMKKLWQQN
ncbi:MAG: hypothetical protein WCB68_01980 [Pyrinomonadaceae bacterium]